MYKKRSFIVKLHQPQKDRINVHKTTITEAFKVLNKKENDVTQRVHWCGFTDIYFRGTKDYIRTF